MTTATRLPPYHVPRPRLVEPLLAARFGVVLAGSGYGKSALATELVERAGNQVAHAVFDPTDRTQARFLSRVADKLRHSGLGDLAAPIVDYETEAEAIDSLLALLSERATRVTLIFDDVQILNDDSSALIAQLAAALPDPHAVLVLGRQLNGALADALEQADVVLDGAALALTSEEVGALCTIGFELDIEEPWVGTLHEATAGWTAAVVLAAVRLDRTGGSVAVIQDIARRGQHIAHLVEDLLVELTEGERDALTQFAHLPLLSPAMGAATGFPDLFSRSAQAGLPYSVIRDNWFEMPGPVQEHLAGLGPLEPAVALRASETYRRRNELAASLGVLLAADDATSAAKLLADLPQNRIDALDASLIELVVGTLPDQAVTRFPRVLLHLARAYEDRVELQRLEETLIRARALQNVEPAMAREVEGEMARYLVTEGRFEEAEELALRILDEAAQGESVNRSMAMEVLGRIAAHEGTDESLERAGQNLEEAVHLARRDRPARWVAQTLMNLAYRVHIERGEYATALSNLDEAIALLPPGGRRRGAILTFRAIALQDLGRFEEAQADLEESRAIGEALADRRVQAYAAWQIAVGAARQGDAATTVSALVAVDRFRGDWFDHPTGLEFLADAVDCCSLVEETGLLEEYLERLRDRMVRRREPNVAEGFLAEAAALARSGDADAALSALAALDELDGIAPAERWRIKLLRAFVGWRRGEPAAGALAAEAFDAAAAAGNPRLPFIRERRVASALAGLASEAGSAAAAASSEADLPMSVAVLGRFEVAQAGRVIAIAPGKPQEIVKVLAVNGGQMATDALIESLWPEVEPSSGRKRLRNALNRLNIDEDTFVLREGETLSLPPDTAIDAVLFETQGLKAIAAAPGESWRAAGLARAALARYLGELLPADPYAEWAAEPRERLRRLSLSLLDILADSAATRGDVDEAVRHLERAIAVERYDEFRYARAAELLINADRRARAIGVLDRAAAMLDELGLSPAQQMVDLRSKALS